MPAFDGTGPLGKGPLTGRGKGYCAIKVGSSDDENQLFKKDEREEVFDMPRGDGTGPMGLGPMTGRAAGLCAGYSVPGYMNPAYGRGYFGRGRGSFGRGGGRGFRNQYYATGLYGWQRASMGMPFGFAQGGPAFNGGYPYAPEVTPKQEADILKNEADILKGQLEDIQQRIESLDKAQSEKVE